MSRSTVYLIASIALALIAHHCDYLLQAYQHHWWTWLDLTARAPKWGWFDFVPHDTWHLVQWLYHASLLTFAPLAWWFGMVLYLRRGLYVNGVWHVRGFDVLARPLWAGYLSMWLVYLITRGLAFSLVYRLTN